MTMENNLDANNQAESDAESRGNDHREIQDNGTGGATYNVQGQSIPVNYPLPNDPNSPKGKDYGDGVGDSDLEISDFGLNETVEVGHKGGVQDFGFVGSAGGGIKKNQQ